MKAVQGLIQGLARTSSRSSLLPRKPLSNGELAECTLRAELPVRSQMGETARRASESVGEQSQFGPRGSSTGLDCNAG
jgi:hypothetical protein